MALFKSPSNFTVSLRERILADRFWQCLFLHLGNGDGNVTPYKGIIMIKKIIYLKCLAEQAMDGDVPFLGPLPPENTSFEGPKD